MTATDELIMWIEHVRPWYPIAANKMGQALDAALAEARAEGMRAGAEGQMADDSDAVRGIKGAEAAICLAYGEKRGKP